MNTPTTKSAEQRAKELLLKAICNQDIMLPNVVQADVMDKDIGLTAIITERDELKDTNNVLHQLMTTAENRGVGKATIELGETINKITEDFHRVIAELDKAVQRLNSLESVAGGLADAGVGMLKWSSNYGKAAMRDALTDYNKWRKENE